MTRFVFLTALTFSVFVYASTVRAQDTLVLQGQVYIANYGVPLEKAQVDVRISGKFVLQQKTDQQGNFKILGLAAGEYQLDVGLSGFRPERLAFTVESGKVMTLDVGLQMGHWVDFSIIAPDGKELQNVDPSLIGGVVKQTNGKPIRDATVVLISLFSNDKPIEALTDSKGEYSFHAVEGQFVIYVYKRGYLAQSDTMMLNHPSYGYSKSFTLKMTDER